MDGEAREHVQAVIGGRWPRMLLAIVPDEMREAIEGDLLEQMERDVLRTRGIEGARAWLSRELLRSMPAALAHRARRGSGSARILRWIACIAMPIVLPLHAWSEGASPIVAALLVLAATPVSVAAFFTAGPAVTLRLFVGAFFLIGIASMVAAGVTPELSRALLNLFLISSPGLFFRRPRGRRRPQEPFAA